MEKPEKEVFEDVEQERLYKLVKEKLKKIFESDTRIKEIRLFGSCAKKKFGKYKETYKPRTKTARNYSDIDAFFIFDDLKGKQIILKNNYVLNDGEFIKDGNNKDIYIENHPLMCGGLTTIKNYYEKLNEPWPEGFDFTKDSILLFKRD